MMLMRTKTNNPANAAKPNGMHACFALLISQINVLVVSVVHGKVSQWFLKGGASVALGLGSHKSLSQPFSLVPVGCFCS